MLKPQKLARIHRKWRHLYRVRSYFQSETFSHRKYCYSCAPLNKQRCCPGDDAHYFLSPVSGGCMSKKGIRALVYVSCASVFIWGAAGYLVMQAVHVM